MNSALKRLNTLRRRLRAERHLRQQAAVGEANGSVRLRDARTRELLEMLSHASVKRLLVMNAAAQGETFEGRAKGSAADGGPAERQDIDQGHDGQSAQKGQAEEQAGRGAFVTPRW